ncbi:8080_t:CDS:2, partial [Scutellospora calospora]
DLRNFRIKTAFQATVQHVILPNKKWTKPKEYFSPQIDEAVKEEEREAFDAIKNKEVKEVKEVKEIKKVKEVKRGYFW